MGQYEGSALQAEVQSTLEEMSATLQRLRESVEKVDAHASNLETRLVCVSLSGRWVPHSQMTQTTQPSAPGAKESSSAADSLLSGQSQFQPNATETASQGSAAVQGPYVYVQGFGVMPVAPSRAQAPWLPPGLGLQPGAANWAAQKAPQSASLGQNPFSLPTSQSLAAMQQTKQAGKVIGNPGPVSAPEEPDQAGSQETRTEAEAAAMGRVQHVWEDYDLSALTDQHHAQRGDEIADLPSDVGKGDTLPDEQNSAGHEPSPPDATIARDISQASGQPKTDPPVPISQGSCQPGEAQADLQAAETAAQAADTQEQPHVSFSTLIEDLSTTPTLDCTGTDLPPKGLLTARLPLRSKDKGRGQSARASALQGTASKAQNGGLRLMRHDTAMPDVSGRRLRDREGTGALTSPLELQPSSDPAEVSLEVPPGGNDTLEPQINPNSPRAEPLEGAVDTSAVPGNGTSQSEEPLTIATKESLANSAEEVSASGKSQHPNVEAPSKEPTDGLQPQVADNALNEAGNGTATAQEDDPSLEQGRRPPTRSRAKTVQGDSAVRKGAPSKALKSKPLAREKKAAEARKKVQTSDRGEAQNSAAQEDTGTEGPNAKKQSQPAAPARGKDGRFRSAQDPGRATKKRKRPRTVMKAHESRSAPLLAGADEESNGMDLNQRSDAPAIPVPRVADGQLQTANGGPEGTKLAKDGGQTRAAKTKGKAKPTAQKAQHGLSTKAALAKEPNADTRQTADLVSPPDAVNDAEQPTSNTNAGTDKEDDQPPAKRAKTMAKQQSRSETGSKTQLPKLSNVSSFAMFDKLWNSGEGSRPPMKSYVELGNRYPNFQSRRFAEWRKVMTRIEGLAHTLGLTVRAVAELLDEERDRTFYAYIASLLDARRGPDQPWLAEKVREANQQAS